MTLYVEASALVKLFVLDERGRADVLQVLEDEGNDIVTSRLTSVETRAALAAARRSGRITTASLASAKESLEVLMGEIAQIDTSEELARLAGDLAETHRLRGGDALHLASALSVADAELSLVTWDHSLAKAARRSGLTTIGIL